MNVQGITHKDLMLLIGDVATIVQDLYIKEDINNHGQLQLAALLEEDDRQQILYEDIEEFAIFYQEGDKIQLLFQGIIMESYIQAYGDIYLLQMKAQTATCFMDVTRKKRLFQDTTITSHQLVKQIMMIYQGSKYLTFIPDLPIDEPIVQYEETDWEFLKRFFSRYGVPVFVDCNGTEQRFMAGISKASSQVDWTEMPYEVLYQMDWLHYLEKNTDISVGQKQGISYQVVSYEIHSLGSSVKINNEEMYIGNIERKLVDGILTNEYTLYYEKGFMIPQYYNHNITGVSVEGQIENVKRNKVQVRTNIEGLISRELHWFPFSTVAASRDGSGWYCMPEIGEQVRLHFPTNDENEGYVITSIQGYLPDSPQSKTVMSNPDMKNISANNKNLFFDADGIIFDADNGNGQVKISKLGEIVLNAKQSIMVQASENIMFHAQKQLIFASDGDITIKNDAGGHISIEEGQLKLKGNNIHLNPSISEDNQENQSSE